MNRDERLEMLSAVLRMEPTFLQQCVQYEVICLDDIRQERVELPPAQVDRLKRLQRICRSMDIDVFAGCIIVDLVDRVDELQRELEHLLRAGAESET